MAGMSGCFGGSPYITLQLEQPLSLEVDDWASRIDTHVLIEHHKADAA
jgi:hypothetical protein